MTDGVTRSSRHSNRGRKRDDRSRRRAAKAFDHKRDKKVADEAGQRNMDGSLRVRSGSSPLELLVV
jgi:hypothetical protein